MVASTSSDHIIANPSLEAASSITKAGGEREGEGTSRLDALANAGNVAFSQSYGEAGKVSFTSF